LLEANSFRIQIDDEVKKNFVVRMTKKRIIMSQALVFHGIACCVALVYFLYGNQQYFFESLITFNFYCSGKSLSLIIENILEAGREYQFMKENKRPAESSNIESCV